MSENTTYIDESGNNGGDIWSARQPYFVISAITIPNKNISFLRSFIDKEYIGNKINTEKEFKAITWVKNPKKRKSLELIVNEMAKLHAGIAIVIVEKRFMEAALIVDTFFDGAYNEIEDYSWCNNKDLKRTTADYYYDRLSDDDLNLIAQTIIKSGDVATYQECLNRALQVTDDKQFRKILEGARPHLLEISKVINETVGIEEGLRRNILRSPNYTGFYTIGNMLAKRCILNRTTTDLVFDSASMCNKEFESLYNHFAQAEKDLIMPTFLEIFSWKERLTSFTAEDSRQNSCLLAGDILASSMYNTFTKLKKNDTIYRYDAYMLGLYFTLLQNESLLPVASTQFYKSAFNALSHYSKIIDELKD